MKRNIAAICLILLSVGCSGPKSSLDSESAGTTPFPPDFQPKAVVLLIEQSIDEDKSSTNLSTTSSVRTDSYMNYFMKKNRKAMEEYANKNYPYQHEFASQTDIYESSQKYSDKSRYRYALVTSITKPIQAEKVAADGRTSSTYNQPVFKFYIYDRLNDKTYSALGHGSSLVMWAYKDAIKKIGSK